MYFREQGLGLGVDFMLAPNGRHLSLFIFVRKDDVSLRDVRGAGDGLTVLRTGQTTPGRVCSALSCIFRR